jgi:hypothetical protein
MLVALIPIPTNASPGEHEDLSDRIQPNGELCLSAESPWGWCRATWGWCRATENDKSPAERDTLFGKICFTVNMIESIS